MTTLVKASNQWMSRPDDERFVSLLDMQDAMAHNRSISAQKIVASRDLEWSPTMDGDLTGLQVHGKQGAATNPSHWAFGQACARVGAPAGYLRTLPAAMAADCLNYGFKFARDVEEVGVLLRVNGERTMAAMTGPNYGRIWNHEIVDALVDKFGDGVSGNWRVPGEFSKRVEVTKANTTLYAGDRDMFVFLCDEDRRIEMPNRRDGKTGSLARGFFVWNSEVGSDTFGYADFIFDYVCSNRMVWGAQGYREIKIRHTAGAPHRMVEQVLPAIRAIATSSAAPIEATLKAAQEKKIDDLSTFLKNKRFTVPEITGAMTAFKVDENRDMVDKQGAATVWDAVTGITAYARGMTHQDRRVDLERKAGKLLELVAVR